MEIFKAILFIACCCFCCSSDVFLLFFFVLSHYSTTLFDDSLSMQYTDIFGYDFQSYSYRTRHTKMPRRMSQKYALFSLFVYLKDYIIRKITSCCCCCCYSTLSPFWLRFELFSHLMVLFGAFSFVASCT